MRRTLRILLTAATVLSLVLCVATCALWVRSYYAYDEGRYLTTLSPGPAPAKRQYAIGSRGGMLTWETSSYQSYRPKDVEVVSDPNADSGWHWKTSTLTPADRRAYLRNERFAGLATVRPDTKTFRNLLGSDVTRRRLVISHSFPAAGLALLPALALVLGLRRRSRSRKGLCPACGYDLRATPDRCPECGAVPSAKDARLPKPGG